MATSLRPFEKDDIPAVVRLRRRSFRRSTHATDDRLASYFRTVFFENPWSAGEPAGFVTETDGQLGGFVGLIPRPMRLGNRRIRGAVSTQFMVAPEHRGAAGLMIMRALFSGSQDLLLADAGNAGAERLWCGLGGAASPSHRFQWYRSVRPGRSAVGRMTRRVSALAVLNPLGSGADRIAARLLPSRFGIPRPPGERTALDAAAAAELLPTFFGPHTVQPVYTGESLQWLLDRVADKYGAAAVHARMVLQDGGAIGWFVYVRAGNGAAVLQLAARPDAVRAVVQHLVADVWAMGLVTLEGRFQPEFADALVERGATFEPRGSGIYVHSRQPELVRQVLGGNAFLTGLEGEWWLSF